VSAKEGQSGAGLPRPTIRDDVDMLRDLVRDLREHAVDHHGDVLARVLDYVEHVAEEREATCLLLGIGGDDPARWLEWADGRDGSMGPCGPFPLYEAIEAAVKPEESP
jgi:hypothetical protein